MATITYSDHVRHWGDLTAAIAANPDLAFLEPQRLLLEADLETLRDTSVRQAHLRRQTQEASIELAETVKRGRDLATRLHDAIRGFYGRTGEMLVEYRLQPRRSKPPKPAPPVETEKPSELGSTPARTAAPETDASTQE